MSVIKPGSSELFETLRGDKNMSFNFEKDFAKAMYENRLKATTARKALIKEQKEKSNKLHDQLQAFINKTFKKFVSWSKGGMLFSTKHIPNRIHIIPYQVPIELQNPQLIVSTSNQIKIEFIFRHAQPPHPDLQELVPADAMGFLGFTDAQNVTLGFNLYYDEEQNHLFLAEYDEIRRRFQIVTDKALGKLIIYLLTKLTLDKYDDSAFTKVRPPDTFHANKKEPKEEELMEPTEPKKSNLSITI